MEQNEYERGWRFEVGDGSADFGFIHPDTNPKFPQYIEMELEHVRASDGIRVSYDFERDGWSIRQPTDDTYKDWSEVAFVGSWGLFSPKQ